MNSFQQTIFLGLVCAAAGPRLGAQANTDLAHAQATARAIYNFGGRCAQCHDTHLNGAPDRHALNEKTPEAILASLSTGSMAEYSKGMSELELRAMAVYVGGRPLGAAPGGEATAMKNRCPAAAAGDLMKGAAWNGWGYDAGNSRFQPEPGISPSQVPNLKLKWAFGFPEGNSAYAQPTAVGGRVYIGSDTGYVYSLDSATGCVHWSFKAKAGIRTAVSVGREGRAGVLVYFGDVKGNVYAVNAATGAQAWTQLADTHPIARITGSPTLAGGRLYVPVASLEESSGGNPKYACCTFRGSVVAYDAATGKQIWKSYTIPEEPKPTKKTSLGTQLWGPAGAGIWSSPAIDAKRKTIYVATGNSYTEPAGDTSDAVIALDLETGKRLWSKQVMAKDASVSNCHPAANETKSETCPEDLGPDYDFGNAPILRTLADGRTLIFIGQKSGDAWALDPAKQGAVVWQKMVGPEDKTGGMMWGSAADNQFAYFPVTARAGKQPIGLAAVKLSSGELAWRAGTPVGSGAPASVIPGVLFSGSSSGTIYAFSTADGKTLWQFDTAREFETVNGVAAKGGNMNGSGPVVAGGMLFVPSGYADLGGGVRGNVLLAFGSE